MSFCCSRQSTGHSMNSLPTTKSSKLRPSVSETRFLILYPTRSLSIVLTAVSFPPGDSYVAVTGLPKPQERHALLMARFAWDCLLKFEELTRELETKLGPDTTELGIRFGMHSGMYCSSRLKSASHWYHHCILTAFVLLIHTRSSYSWGPQRREVSFSTVR